MARRNPRYVTLYTVTASTASLSQVTAQLRGIDGGVRKAAVPAVNKTLSKGRTWLRQGLTKFLTIKSSNLNRRIFVSKATQWDFEGSIKLMGRKIGLINFKSEDTRKSAYDPTGKGVFAQVIRGGPVLRLPFAFIAKGRYGNKVSPAGNVHVFQRDGAGRSPIETQYSQRLYDLFKQSPVPAQLKRDLPVELRKNLNTEANRVLINVLRKPKP
jgi:hypothetical protein